MISRAKPFLKIHKLSRGRGQAALKGQVVHFAQSIEEVQEQLRLGPNSTYGTIIVTETVGDFPHSSTFEMTKWQVANTSTKINYALKRNRN